MSVTAHKSAEAIAIKVREILIKSHLSFRCPRVLPISFYSYTYYIITNPDFFVNSDR